MKPGMKSTIAAQMIPINRTYAPLQAFVDERAGGFVALGLAKASGRPVAVTCTSGTAAANLHPAVAEAWEARLPLIVLTADRPPELRGVGAGQAIDQLGLFGSAAKWFVEVGTHEPGGEGGGGGPAAGATMDPAVWSGREDGSPWTQLRGRASAPHADDLHALAAQAASTPRGAIVCGPTLEDVAEPAARLAAEAGWPLLAEPTSGVRCGDHDRSHVVAHYDVLLRVERFARDHSPDLVLRVGDTPTSKPLREWLAGTPQGVLDPHAAWNEPTRRA